MSGDLSLADRLAITALSDEFGRCLDHGDLEGFLAIFTEDADYRNGARQLKGREEIAAFFRTRAAAGRTSRHLHSGLRLRASGPEGAEGESVWLTFAGAGPPPVADAAPAAVSDVSDVYRREDGVWRIASRRIAQIFVNPGFTPPVPPQARS